MHSSLHAIFLLALVTLALAAPRNAPIQKRGVFKVERVPNPNFKRSPGAGTRALIKAHRKYSVPLPEGLVAAMNAANAANAASAPKSNSALTGETAKKGAKGNAKASGTAVAAAPLASASGGVAAKANGTAGTGKVTATPINGDVEYLSPVNIGGQTLNLDFDSGSSDLWVFNSQLSTASQTGHTVFNVAKSQTLQMMTGATYSISYGDGSGSAGNVGTDTVNMPPRCQWSEAIELATAVSASFVEDTASNGLVGLAFSKLNTVKPTQQKTFFDNAMPNLAEPVFTADLRSNAVGAYEFGAIDTSKFNGTMQWAAVNTTNGFWQFSSEKFQVGDATPMAVPGGQAIADTGTTLMLTSAAVVNAYYANVQGAVNDQQVGGVTFPCNSQLPDLQFDVGGSFMANVKGSDINFAPVDNAGTTCFGGVQAIQSNLQIYGDIMFKSQFVAFNGGNNSIGMAPHQ
ncbi:putative aspergillopepsin A-like aspartic endopeptidase [Glarea lozoyensis 74030]|uniref:Putative aspergillopepsin A-like aspartic endopeptidase n=1 Tax=Glarea lozoyensis (strain ATCC 74030 / MF5533) TaxID=1104152 RepID=H0EK58_GLAL7|nr:putative aspergillopepsin A-like aspartic endopeptidase [Glarea lozoyensis 74030]